MPNASILATLHEVRARTPALRDFLELCKPKVVLVLLLTALVGMFLATPGIPDWQPLLFGITGIGLSAGAAAAVNHIMDQKYDAQMSRTHQRPLPQGRISERQALVFAAGIGVLGIGMLMLLVNPLTAWLTLASLIGYALIYTVFLKRATPQNIVIGGLAGAAPPLLGWTAVTGQFDANALLLVLIIFAWTPPHFWALCIHKKDDYARAGVPMLPVTHGESYTRLHILLYTLLMIVTTVFPYITGMSGELYLFSVTLINLRFLYWAIKVMKAENSNAPWAMFMYSIKYIMLLFVCLLTDHFVMLMMG